MDYDPGPVGRVVARLVEAVIALLLVALMGFLGLALLTGIVRLVAGALFR